VFLTSLALLNFKNHESLKLAFSRKINCIIGQNGIGKTNVLDAIHYACLTKSYFNAVDQQNILFEKDFMRLDAEVVIAGEKLEVVCKLPQGKKKEFLLNEVPYKRMSEHIGKMPVIMITPDDNQLILGGSEERRKFLDNSISQIEDKYLNFLMLYNQNLEQRNALLKQAAEKNVSADIVLLSHYDAQLELYGNYIYTKRKAAVAALLELFQKYYSFISLEREMVSFEYTSQLHENSFSKLLLDNRNRDKILQRTSVGIHKDDLDFKIGENKMRKFGSQGQQKSFIIALKFAQYDFIKFHKTYKPFLLIDDIFDKLDKERSNRLMELVSGESFGQIFITDTDEAHILNALESKQDLFEIKKI